MSEPPDNQIDAKRAAAAKRALAEAQARRDAEIVSKQQAETDGPAGQEPTRFGDWERKGIAYDF